jgi:lactate permease
MLGFRWGGAKAGAVGLLVALLVAVFQFGAGPVLLAWAQVRALFLALYVLYIIWGALAFFRVTEAAGSVDALAAVLRARSPKRPFQAILLGWGFASFLQSVGGFGVPVAVTAPLLMGLGFSPLESVLMPSLGHAWAVSFGSLGSSFFALMAATGLEGDLIAPWVAGGLGVVCLMVGPMVLWIAGGEQNLHEGTFIRQLLPVMAMAIAMAGVQILAARAGLWNISAMLGALAGLIIGVGWTFLEGIVYPRSATSPPSKKQAGIPLDALLPYLLLLTIIFATRFIKPLHTLLNLIQIRLTVPQVTTRRGWVVPAGTTRSISLFGDPGALLIFAALLTFWMARRRGKLPPDSVRDLWKKILQGGRKSTFGILAMVAMATTMDNTGMVYTLSTAMSDIAGALFPLVAPFIGALGAFMTGSNTNANVLLSAFQRDVARTLGYSVPVILAGHNAGAAVGSVFAPAKVIVGCSTVGLSGKEGEALRRIIRYAILIILVLSALTWAFAGAL